MLEQQGTVVEQRGDWVRVRVERDRHCSHCATTGGCGAVTLAAALPKPQPECWVATGDAVLPGQRVTLGVADGDALVAAALLYLTPLLGMLIAAASLHPIGEVASVVGGVLGFTVGLVLVRLLARRLTARGHWHLQLTNL
ncbi:MAG: SoxR reducing system RseC family protein [Ectothiorhodospiraceae bacterium]